MEFDDTDMALAYLARASQKKGVSLGSLITLADIYVRDKRLDEAAELVARAAQMDRKDSRVLFEEAKLMRLRGNAPQAQTILRELLTNTSADVSVRVRASYELAEILDAEGLYDEAIAALLEAKAILRPHAGPYAATLRHMQ